MFTITNKRRTLIAIGAAGAALAGTGVASAATVVHEPGTGTPIVTSQPTSVARVVDPNKVFGAGNPAWPTSRCEALATLINKDDSLGNSESAHGDHAAAAQTFAEEAQDQETLDNNCGVMD